VGPSQGLVGDVVIEGVAGWRAVVSLGAGAAAWEMTARLVGRFPLPAPSAVVLAAVAMARDGGLLLAVAASLGSLVLGFLGAAVLGVGLGVLIGRSLTVERMLDIYLDAVMSAPTLVYVPVLFALFGASRASQVAVVFAYAFFVIVETTSAGVKQTDGRLIDMARAFGASEQQVFTAIELPAAAPFVLTGLGLGMTRAVKGMVVGEMVIALSGLGAMLRSRGARFDLEGVLALLLVIVMVSVVCNLAVQALGSRLVGPSR
jgi:NitT/TauT family transport system permease protein